MPLPKPRAGMTANPVRPGRYRPGKAIQEEQSSEEEEEEEDDVEGAEAEHEADAAPAPVSKAPPPKFQSGKQAAAAASNLKNLNLEERRRRDLERERAAKDEERRERERMERDAGFVTESESGDDDSKDEEDSAPTTQLDTARRKPQAASSTTKPTGSTSEDSSEEDDSDADSDSSPSSSATRPPLKRPIFIKKSARDATSTITTPSTQALQQQPTTKQSQSDALIQATLDARHAETLSRSRAWDDDAGPIDASGTLLDDTDGLDPALEHAEWVARELSRVKRSRAALEEREAELAEVERRRALATPEREAEDAARMAEQAAAREEKNAAAKEAREKGNDGYLRRYHHKGAFSAGAGDEEAEKALRERDLMTAEYEGSTRMKSALPKYLQRRDETEVGRKGMQRHRDLRSEDTGRWGDFGGGRGGRGPGAGRAAFGNEGRGAFVEDERFRPDDPRDGGRSGPTGANAGVVGERKRAGEYGGRYEDAKRPRREDVR